jgi:hypothetical protein
MSHLARISCKILAPLPYCSAERSEASLTSFGTASLITSLGTSPIRHFVRDGASRCHRMFRLFSLTLKLGYNIQDMRREKKKDSPNAVSLVLRDRSGCFGLSFHFLNLNQNIRLKSLHHNHDDRLQEALSHVKSLNLTRRERL